jgi:hypothetical protein
MKHLSFGNRAEASVEGDHDGLVFLGGAAGEKMGNDVRHVRLLVGALKD